MTLRRSLSIAALLAPAACDKSQPPIPPNPPDPPVASAEVHQPPAADVSAARARTDAGSLKSRVMELMLEQMAREVNAYGDRGETWGCEFYFDPNDRPVSKWGSLRSQPDEPTSVAEINRLTQDIAAHRATILDDRQLAAFDRDVVNRFEDVRARIRKFERR